MTFTAGIVGSIGGGGATSTSTGPDPDPEANPGVQLLDNSKLQGPTSTDATNWTNRYPGEGTITFSASAVADHRKVRLAATSTSDRASIEQTYRVEAGKRYVFSVYLLAIDDASDPSRVIINHSPYSLGDVVGGPEARPSFGTAVAGTRIAYAFDATAAGDIKIIMGPDGPGDCTLERPMLDQVDAGTLRDYVASDPVTPPATTGQYRWDAGFLGFVPVTTSGNNVATPGRGNTGAGWLVKAKKTGTLSFCMFNITTRFAGEPTKSRKDGSLTHPFPASWATRLAVYPALPSGSSAVITGSALTTFDWIHTNESGSVYEDARLLVRAPLSGISVTGGNYYAFMIENLEADPANNHITLNMYRNVTRPAVGTGSGRVDDYHGDYNIAVTRSGDTLSPFPNAIVTGFVYQYAEDGDQAGFAGFDATASNQIRPIGGSDRVRMTITPEFYARCTEVGLAIHRPTASTPEAGITVDISGPGLSRSWTIPVSSIQNYTTNATSPPFQMEWFTISGGQIELAKDVPITITLSSPGTTSGRWTTCGIRGMTWMKIADSRNTNQPPAEYIYLDQHDGEGTGQASSNGGSTWTSDLWSETNFSIALRVDESSDTPF